MTKKETVPLKEQLFVAINKVLKGNKADPTNKLKKIVKKSIKKIAKKANKKIESK
jgi:hypothetical protein